VKIAHFSDVHALSLEGVRPWQWLSKRLPGYVNVRLNRGEKHPVALFEAMIDDLNRRPPDHVIVTGDLTNLSLPPEFRLARSILDRLTLGPTGVTVIPGNHDVYTLDAMVGRLFWRAFRPYAESDEPAASDSGFPVVRVRGEVAIIGLTTARPSPVPFADGTVGKTQLAALEAALDRYRDKFRIVALHHPPYKNRASIFRGLRDRDALAQVLSRAGCGLVIHGHEHRDIRQTLPGPSGPIPIIGVGSATYSDPRPERRARYNVYTVEDNRLTHVETRIHDAASGSFSQSMVTAA
jgi:3',5'-cyclic AMP phosphodiesterase CpdA